MIKKCICGKEYEVSDYDDKRGRGRYCSRECSNKANAKLQCEIAKEEPMRVSQCEIVSEPKKKQSRLEMEIEFNEWYRSQPCPESQMLYTPEERARRRLVIDNLMKVMNQEPGTRRTP